MNMLILLNERQGFIELAVAYQSRIFKAHPRLQSQSLFRMLKIHLDCRVEYIP